MASVTQRIREIQQPRGGFVPAKSFVVEEYKDGIELGEENIHAVIVGLAVDYLTRYVRTHNATTAFRISLMGAKLINKEKLANKLLAKITGLDNESIIAACQLSGFDVCYRVGCNKYKPVEDIIPDESTIRNIKVMVKRSIVFFEKYGPIIKDGFTFEGGYTSIVNTGDGDFLTADTLWDFKVSKAEPKKEYTLQLLMYYLMGVESIHNEFNSIKKLGIFNPRLNKVYTIDIDNISPEIILEVRNNIIGYGLHKINTGKRPKAPKHKETFLSATDVAEILGVSKSKVYNLIRKNEIVAQKQGNRYIISPDAVEEYLEIMKMRKRNAIMISVITVLAMLVSYAWLMSCLMK